MEGTRFLKLLIVIFFLSFFYFFLAQLKVNTNLKKELRQASQKINNAKEARQELDKLKTEIAAIEETAGRIEERIPTNEDKPLKLIREITHLGSRLGARNMEFIFENETNAQPSMDSLKQNNNNSLYQDGSYASSGSEYAESASSRFPSEAINGAQQRIRPILIKINFESQYHALVNFVKELLKTQRLVFIEYVNIERMPGAYPRQKVSMTLVTYTFVSQ
ncbi:MAG: hypothetical protein ABH872_02695 [Candidatus Omnitrophota bacterium]